MASTKHAPDCRMAFGRKDPSCPRCQDLLAGAQTVQWAGTRRRRFQELQQIAEIRAHDCRKSGCGPVCTFGDW